MNTLELLQICMHIETKTIQLSRLFNSIYFWKIRKVEFALKFLHFFVVLKQGPLFGMLEKTKKLLFIVFSEKII